MLCSFLLYSKVTQLYVGAVFYVTNWRSASLSKYLEGRHAFSLITPTHKPSQNNKLSPIIIFLTIFFPFLVARLGKELSAFPFSVSWLTHDSPIHCNLTTAPTIPFGLTEPVFESRSLYFVGSNQMEWWGQWLGCSGWGSHEIGRAHV